MGQQIAGKGGNDKVMTPLYLAKIIVEHFNPKGKILEPCCGTGNFLKIMPSADWYEITKGKDFLLAKGDWDWIITNPPYSKYRAFLNKSMEVADNIVFLQMINAIWFKARLRDMFNKEFGIKEIFLIENPKEFPQFGFQMGCVHFKRKYKGNISFKHNIRP